MPEALVIIACLYGKGCSETSSVYYSQNLELQQVARTLDLKTPAYIKNYVGPVVIFAAGGSGVIKVFQYTNLSLSRTSTELIFKFYF